MAANPFSREYKSDFKPSKQAHGLVKKGKPLAQPPINSQARLQVEPAGKQAKLSRGAAI